MKIAFLLLTLIKIAISSQNLKSNGTNLHGYDKDNNLVIVLSTNKKACPMYSDDCKLNVLVADSIKLTKDDVVISDDDEYYLKVNSVKEKCYNSKILK